MHICGDGKGKLVGHLHVTWKHSDADTRAFLPFSSSLCVYASLGLLIVVSSLQAMSLQH